MTRYLSAAELLAIARLAMNPDPDDPDIPRRSVEVRDHGLLEAAAARPRATVFGQDAYPDLYTKSAALLHSLCGNHALVDGNKRLAWLATYTFLVVNGETVSPGQDEVVEFVMEVAGGDLDDVGAIALRIEKLCESGEDLPADTDLECAYCTVPYQVRDMAYIGTNWTDTPETEGVYYGVCPACHERHGG